MSSVPSVALHDGVRIPQLGLGTFQIRADTAQETVERALEAGYRHLDTAATYGNEEGVGAAIAASAIPREEIFLTTKLRNDDHGYDAALRACEASLGRLGLAAADLYLIHWPVPAADRFLETWRAFERIREEGLARSVGVSNFRLEDLERLRREAELLPSVNQIELHPHLQQAELRAWHAEHGVATEAWSPLAQGGLLGEPRIEEIAERHGRTPAQAILRWHLQLGNIVIPKSADPERQRQNLAVFDFELGEEEMAAIGALEAGRRTGPDPSEFGSA